MSEDNYLATNVFIPMTREEASARITDLATKLEALMGTNSRLLERAVKAEEERDRLRVTFEMLERAATEVARYGAKTGTQWTRLSSALISTRAALKTGAPSHD